ncbi:MAG: PucR family transcriptional regulator [Firmicutes bacterium]|nr:PucR family transcriptional regulator [Bacillota bacterium]
MKVTVRDCLQLDVFKQCITVAGEKNLDNRVRTVSVMDAASLEEALNRNAVADELVLTTFSGMRNDSKLQSKVITQLASRQIAAMVILQTESKGAQTYKEVIKAAEEAGLPLLILVNGEDCDYSKIITDVMEKVLYGSNFKNSLINNTIFHLLNFEKYNNFQQALKEAAVSNDFQVVLLSEDFNQLFAVETRHMTTIDAAIRRGREVAMNLSGVCSLVDIDGVLVYWGIIEIKNDKYYLLIVDNEDNYSAGEITKLAEIIELAMGMWKYTPERDSRVEFIKALMRGNKSLAYTLKEDIDIKPQDILSVFYARGIDASGENAIIDKYEEEGLLKVIKIGEDNECYGVIAKGPDLAGNEEIGEKQVCIRLFDELKEGKTVKIFHVTGTCGIEGAADGFKLINETWSVVGNVFPYKRVFSKYELVLVSNCISIQVQGGYLKKNYMDLLEYFQMEGDNKSRQLLETLETFVLDAGMNSSKTAEFMGIHTNTVQYRLKKINEVLGVEITGNRVIPGLTIALALQRLERVVK